MSGRKHRFCCGAKRKSPLEIFARFSIFFRLGKEALTEALMTMGELFAVAILIFHHIRARGALAERQ